MYDIIICDTESCLVKLPHSGNVLNFYVHGTPFVICIGCVKFLMGISTRSSIVFAGTSLRDV